MPWQTVDTMELRREFIAKWLTRRFSVLELSEAYQVSRKTLYKWIDRFEAGGTRGLCDGSHARHSQEGRVSESVTRSVIALKKAHPTWGPKKLRAALDRAEPDGGWPAPSTIGVLLKQAGLVKAKRRAVARVRITPWQEAREPNDVWAIDFKGQWRLGCGQECYPLTLSDTCTRYLLVCRGLPSVSGRGVRPAMEQAFRTFGLPRAIRSDWGKPFAAANHSIGLTKLSTWWLRLGINLQRIQPGRPQQNGRHERMHRTLKAETVLPTCQSMRAQQARFDRFRQCYNHERPHEALGNRTPADCYRSSPRPYPEKLRDFEYPGHFDLRKVRHQGIIRLHNNDLFLSEALAHQTVGLDEDDFGWKVYFCTLPVAHIDRKNMRITRLR